VSLCSRGNISSFAVPASYATWNYMCDVLRRLNTSLTSRSVRILRTRRGWQLHGKQAKLKGPGTWHSASCTTGRGALHFRALWLAWTNDAAAHCANHATARRPC